MSIIRRSRGPIKRALLIGIDYINTPARLYGCQNDAKNIRNILIGTYGFSPLNIKTLTDDNFKPLFANIMASLEWLVKDTQPGDILFLHYSGHGTSLLDRNSDEIDGRDEAIVPLDYNIRGIISDDILYNFVCKRIPSGVKLYGFFDCCCSGSILDLRYTFKYKAESTVPILPSTNTYISNNWRNNYDMQLEGSLDTVGDVFMFSGCLDNQQSGETVINNQVQGAFTKQLIDFIQSNKGKQITLVEMLKELNARLIINGFKAQNSQLSVGRLDLVGQKFIL
jgi:hypothetical protein